MPAPAGGVVPCSRFLRNRCANPLGRCPSPRRGIGIPRTPQPGALTCGNPFPPGKVTLFPRREPFPWPCRSDACPRWGRYSVLAGSANRLRWWWACGESVPSGEGNPLSPEGAVSPGRTRVVAATPHAGRGEYSPFLRNGSVWVALCPPSPEFPLEIPGTGGACSRNRGGVSRERGGVVPGWGVRPRLHRPGFVAGEPPLPGPASAPGRTARGWWFRFPWRGNRACPSCRS